MYSNIGKKIRLLALILAILGAVVFLGLAVSFLIPAISETEADLKMAGFECAAIFVVLAALSPLFSWILYGFGVLLDTQKQLLAQANEIRNILKKTLANGATADETARKLAAELSKNGYAAGSGNSAPRQAPVLAARPVAVARTPVVVAPEPVEEEYEEEYEETEYEEAEYEEETVEETYEEEASEEVAEEAYTEEAEVEEAEVEEAEAEETDAEPELPVGGIAPIKPLFSDTTY